MKKDVANTALLVMDMQVGILKIANDASTFPSDVAYGIAHARSNNISVINVRVGFRQGVPEICAKNKFFPQAKRDLRMQIWRSLWLLILVLHQQIMKSLSPNEGLVRSPKAILKWF
ncbi:MAG TPA: hypothetical protein VKT28_05450 [Puia sp.]|nr:hypothetical protein [Puia sp.]